MVKIEKKPGPDWLDHVSVIDGNKWLIGAGTFPAQYMMVSEKPGPDEVRSGIIFDGPAGSKLFSLLTQLGFNTEHTYFTAAVKYAPPGNRAVNSGDLKLCRPFFENEVKRCQPEVIVCMGANAVKAVLGHRAKLNDVRGIFVDHPALEGVKVFSTYNPAYILRNPDAEGAYRRDWQILADYQQGRVPEHDKTDVMRIRSVEALTAFREHLYSEIERDGSALICIDCEWHGATWMSPDRYIRTVQIGFRIGAAAVVEFWDEGECPLDPEAKKEGQRLVWRHEFRRSVMDNHEEAWAILKELFTHSKIMIMGHNVIADGEWLLSYGVDIRNNVVFDTMLAEHTLHETGPFSLTELTLKYTNLGRYDYAAAEWKDNNKAAIEHGFGGMPSDILIPYSGTDVDAPLRIAQQQLPHMDEFMRPRGQYPSLWDTVLYTQRMLYELELVGMAIDTERLETLGVAYGARLTELQNRLVALAGSPEVNFPNFNFKSTPQVRTLLFQHLDLTPIKTTKGKPWKDMDDLPGKQQDLVAIASTDGNTLDILQDLHPIAQLLRQVRKLDTVYKVFLRTDEEADESTTGGGIGSKIWVDGRMHAHFSQLAETGRFRHSKPNVANWPKRAESDMVDIFGSKENVPPLIRTIVVPTPNYLLMEADFTQAELFVLAALSGDQTMTEALTTPGKDLHDMTAISAFQLQVLGPDGKAVDESQLLELAATDFDAFEAYQKNLTYLDQRGHQMSRNDFKSGIRVSAKNLNFGIPYGRGALDIARQVKGETGVDTDIEILENEIAQMMDAWKTITYPAAWAYMVSCAEQVIDPGYIVNPWGRYRRFPAKVDRKLLPGMQRQAQNFPIQSTVADTCMIAMQLMDEYRAQHGLTFRLVNQIHDAIIVEVPILELEQTKQMFYDTMGSIDIPINSGLPLRLNIDIEVMTRWGEKER